MRWVLAFVIKVIVPLAAIVCPHVTKLLLLALKTLVALAEPDGQFIPLMAPVATALCNDIVLLLTFWVNVPVGVALNAGN